METKLKETRDYLYDLQSDFEESSQNRQLVDQSIRVSQRARALLDIYQQMVEKGRVFDEAYLEQYLRR